MKSLKLLLLVAALAVPLMGPASARDDDDNKSDWVTDRARDLNDAIDEAGQKLERFPPTRNAGRKIREQAEENRDNHPELRRPPRR